MATSRVAFAASAPLARARARRRACGARMALPPPDAGPVGQPAVVPVDAASARARNAALRVRQHVNPLAGHFQRPVALAPGWAGHAFDGARPLVVDVGVARGRWARAMALRDPARNYLGLEIRAPLVAAANAVRDRDGVGNLHYLYCNANVSFDHVARSAGEVELVCFQFCDPWFKARHAKRRLVQAPLAAEVAAAARGGRVYIASDVEALAREMREVFLAVPGVSLAPGARDGDGWLCDNPFGVPTERETAVRAAGGRVFRDLYAV